MFTLTLQMLSFILLLILLMAKKQNHSFRSWYQPANRQEPDSQVALCGFWGSISKKTALCCRIPVPSHFSVSRHDQMKALTALFRGRRLHKRTSALLFSPWLWPGELQRCHAYTAPLFSFNFSPCTCLYYLLVCSLSFSFFFFASLN